MTTPKRPIVLITGLWMSPRIWDDFRQFYHQRGHRVYAPSWPGLKQFGEGKWDASAGISSLGVKEVVDYFERFVRTFADAPILMGHSLGGLFVQKLLDRGLGAAGVAINSPAPKGILRMPFTQMKSIGGVLSNPFNLRRVVELTFEQFKYAFANTMTPAEASRAYSKYVVHGPGRVLFQLALANLTFRAATKVNFANTGRARLLLIAGGKDRFAPTSVIKESYYKHLESRATTSYKEFTECSQMVLVEDGWNKVAEFALTWANVHAKYRHNVQRVA